MITHTPGVCGGRACLANTRLAIWVLVRFRELGADDKELLSCFPSITQDQLDEAFAYAANHPHEITQDIDQQEKA